ncbi:alpha/beta-hydrolase [Corynespora cassiicola Philippines]|uniref:Alpha/beta-hydrolase n=1 Tax=Corynespora cassiicola Philippines TaxID=1448308 RepID=A0A2T2N4Y3_CORCC|nr:alpha/beta-hydrolase [Corynespora cassiicola Philippines]
MASPTAQVNVRARLDYAINFLGTAHISTPLKTNRFKAFHRWNLQYKTENNQPIDIAIFAPKCLKLLRGVPIHVKFHGGGFVTGKTNVDFVFAKHLIELTESNNAIIIAPDHRLLPEHDGNDIIRDIQYFWKHVQSDQFRQELRDTILDYFPDDKIVNFNWERVLVSGDSAGGFLAAYSALHLMGKGSHLKIKAAYLQYPMLGYYKRSFPTWNGYKWVPADEVQELLRTVLDSPTNFKTLDPKIRENLNSYRETASGLQLIEKNVPKEIKVAVCEWKTERDIETLMQAKKVDPNLKDRFEKLTLKLQPNDEHQVDYQAALYILREAEIDNVMERIAADPRETFITEKNLETAKHDKVLRETAKAWNDDPRIFYADTWVSEKEAKDGIEAIDKTVHHLKITGQIPLTTGGVPPDRATLSNASASTDTWTSWFKGKDGTLDMLDRVGADIKDGSIQGGECVGGVVTGTVEFSRSHTLPPFFILHGARDVNCPIGDTERFIWLCRRAWEGVDMYLHREEGKGHGFDHDLCTGGRNRVEWLKNVNKKVEEAWLR